MQGCAFRRRFLTLPSQPCPTQLALFRPKPDEELSNILTPRELSKIKSSDHLANKGHWGYTRKAQPPSRLSHPTYNCSLSMKRKPTSQYTDGSAAGKTTTENAAMISTEGYPTDPVVIHMPSIRGAELTSSYEEEKATLLLTLDWARANCPTERITICSNSQ